MIKTANINKEKLNKLILETGIPNYLSSSQIIKDNLGEFDASFESVSEAEDAKKEEEIIKAYDDYVTKACAIIKEASVEAEKLREEDYIKAMGMLENADVNYIGTDNPLLLAAEAFRKIGRYKDSAKLEKECLEKYKNIKEDIEIAESTKIANDRAKKTKRKNIILISIFVIIMLVFLGMFFYYYAPWFGFLKPWIDKGYLPSEIH